MTDEGAAPTPEQVAALAALLLPYREQVEAVWAGRLPLRQPAPPVKAPPGVAPDLLDVPTVAVRLSCSRGHVYNLLAAGHLVRRNISVSGKTSKVRITAKSVDEYIAGNLTRGANRA